MASVNPLSRELVFKIVYYGPGLGGKTTTLEYLHATARPEHRGKLVSLATPVDRTLYFDFLPVRLPPIRGMNVRLQLFTVPGQVYFNATRKLVLTGADGVVFVSDSQSVRSDANLESLENLRENLAEQGRELGKLPLVFQHNKRDLPEVLPTEELDNMLNPFDAPAYPSCAKTGDGVYEALEKISERVLKSFEGRISHLGGRAFEASFAPAEGGLASALRDASPSPAGPAVVARISGENAKWGTMPPLSALDSQRDPDGGAQNAARSERVDGRSVRPDSDGHAEDAFPLRIPSSKQREAQGGGGLSTGAGVRRPGVSFAELWPDAEGDTVREVEAALAMRRYARAVELCDALVSRVFASAAGLFGSAEAPRDPVLVPVLLGLDGRRYLAFRSTVREARTGTVVDPRDALAAFAFAIEARIARSSV